MGYSEKASKIRTKIKWIQNSGDSTSAYNKTKSLENEASPQ